MVRLFLLLCAMAAPGLVDTRLLGKPRTYGGNKAEWTSWKYVLRSYLGAVNPELLQPLQESEAALTPIALYALEEKQQANARTISLVLSQMLVGAPLQLIMNISDMNGFEMWRQLVKAEERTSWRRSACDRQRGMCACLPAKFCSGLAAERGDFKFGALQCRRQETADLWSQVCGLLCAGR